VAANIQNHYGIGWLGLVLPVGAEREEGPIIIEWQPDKTGDVTGEPPVITEWQNEAKVIEVIDYV